MHINETNILKPNKYSVGLVWAPPPLTIDISVYICRITKCIYATKTNESWTECQASCGGSYSLKFFCTTNNKWETPY